MTLSNLTTSGWVLLGFTVAGLLDFVIAIARHESKGDLFVRSFWLAPMITWLLWLVTP